MRDATNKLLNMIEEGILDPTAVLKSCLDYMSEDDVADMAECEGYISADDEEGISAYRDLEFNVNCMGMLLMKTPLG